MKTNQASPEEIIASAQKLFASGETAEAQSLLLDEGYVKRSVPRIQEAYLTLIPASPTLQAMLDEVYRDLDDPSPKVRLNAATTLSREFSKEILRDNVRWMRDPRASEPLFDAVDDPDPKVSERALNALANLVCSYFPDQRTLPVFRTKLKDRKQQVRSNAISGIGCLRQEEALAFLVEPLDQGADQDRAAVVAAIAGLVYESWYHKHQHPIQWTKAGKNFWRDRMIAALRDSYPFVRRQAAVALQHFGDPEALPALEEARRTEPDDATFHPAYFMDEAIAALRQST